MSASPPHYCEAIRIALADPDIPLSYNDRLREYSVAVLDGGSSGVVLFYCPFCGAKLPDSVRDEWFDELDRLSLEPNSSDIPTELLGGEWWRSRGQGPD